MKLLSRVVLLLSFVFACSVQSFAQDDIDKLLQESAEDAEKLMGAYIAPFMKSVSSGLNQGWYNTAKPHKIVGIDITVTANAMAIPNKELFYKVEDLDLEHLELDESSPDYPYAPTIFGSEEEPEFRLKDTPLESFTGPSGMDLKGNTGYNMVPVPMAQVGLGLPKGTELKVRFVPTIDLGDDAKLNLIGFGIMHDVKQWIPGIKMMPFDLSGFIGHTRFKIQSEFNDLEVDGDNQRGVMEMSATTIQGLISKKISVLTIYGGIGYNFAKSKLAVQGTYDFNEDGDTNDVREKNPINLDYSTSGPRMTAGMRLKLLILTLHADYTVQKYKCFTAGIGLSIR